MARLAALVAGFALLAAGCGQTPDQKAGVRPAPDSALQPRLEPPPQVMVVPAPEAAAAPLPRAARPTADEQNRDLAERVKRALEDESRIQAAAIDVTAAGGTVTLWGTAASDDERARATRVAQRISGVKWVNNKLAIASGS
jgi:hypothetical protein